MRKAGGVRIGMDEMLCLGVGQGGADGRVVGAQAALILDGGDDGAPVPPWAGGSGRAWPRCVAGWRGRLRGWRGSAPARGRGGGRGGHTAGPRGLPPVAPGRGLGGGGGGKAAGRSGQPRAFGRGGFGAGSWRALRSCPVLVSWTGRRCKTFFPIIYFDIAGAEHGIRMSRQAGERSLNVLWRRGQGTSRTRCFA